MTIDWAAKSARACNALEALVMVRLAITRSVKSGEAKRAKDVLQIIREHEDNWERELQVALHAMGGGSK